MTKQTLPLQQVIFTVSTLAATLGSTNASAHGYMTYPQDYAYSCFVGSPNSSELCNNTVSQQKNEINQNPAGNHKVVLRDGQLCSATKSGAYSMLDVPSPQRYTTTLIPDENGMVEIQYIPTAAHRTWFWDSPEAFYSCANVYVSPDDDTTPEPGNPWPVSERFAAEETAIDLGYTVIARIMENGNERFKIPLNITAANLVDEQWKIELAEKINSDLSASKFMQVGVRNDNDEIIMSADPDQNYIHFKQENWSHLIESHHNDMPDVPYRASWSNHQLNTSLQLMT